MSARVRCYFDFVSPYTCLALEAKPEFAERIGDPRPGLQAIPGPYARGDQGAPGACKRATSASSSPRLPTSSASSASC